MQYLGVITHPDKQSTSPAFQQAAIDALDLGLKYDRWPTPPDALATRITGMRAPSVLGANVTIPHKEAVMPMLDDLDELVSRVGAVNTVINREGRLSGYNTDVEGFLRALREISPTSGGQALTLTGEARGAAFDPGGKHIAIAGAGGAARAVVVALIEAGAASITVLNRTLDRVEHLIADVRPFTGATRLQALPATPESWAKVAADAELLVNCTSLGSEGAQEDESPVPAELIRPEMLVYDLVYRPAETRLLRDARSRGARTLGGLPMLIYQGAASFKIWTDLDPPLDVMFDAARRALGLEPPR